MLPLLSQVRPIAWYIFLEICRLILNLCSQAAAKKPVVISQIQVLSLNPKTHFIAPSQTGIHFKKKTTCQVAKKAKNPSETQTVF